MYQHILNIHKQCLLIGAIISHCDAWWFWRKSEGCSLNLNKDLSHIHEPVFLKKGPRGLELAMPTLVDDDGVFRLLKGEELIVACPGRKNEIRGITISGSQSAVSKCVSGHMLHVKHEDVAATDIDCKRRVFVTLKMTERECGGYIGEELELGYEISGWHRLITCCYYRNHGESLYTTHILYGSTLKGAELKSDRPNFLRGPKSLYHNFSPDFAYKQKNQRNILARLLGENKANYMLARSFLARSHLSPDGDFLLGSWQHLTYFYVNTAPQWQSINGGNWQTIETVIRQHAINLKADLIITTGTYGVLTVEDEQGYPRKLYLEPYQELLPVPELFWKMVVNPEKNACIVFVVTNNPFDESPLMPICDSICYDHGWPSDLNSHVRGRVYCCTYEDFIKLVSYAPEHNCQTVLDNEYL